MFIYLVWDVRACARLLVLIKKHMNHATICIFLNQLKHPLPNLFNSIQLNSTQISSSSLMYNDSGGLKTNKNQTEIKSK